MRLKTLLFVFVTFSQSLFSQTYISDGDLVSGTWKSSKSPYIVLGEAIVAEGSVLTIEPGVVVKFKTGTNRDYLEFGTLNKSSNFNVGFLRVYGKILAEGTENKRIKFTSDGEGNWGNIMLDTQEFGNKFKYCLFEHAYYLRYVKTFEYTDKETGEKQLMYENATGALSFINSTAMVEYCIFANNGWTAINCKQSSRPTLKNLTIYNNEYGLECNSESKPTFISCILWNSRVQTFYVNQDSKPHVSYCLIQDQSLDFEYNKGNNIFAKDPKFKKPEKGKFTLKDDSPCKGTGIENQNMGAE